MFPGTVSALAGLLLLAAEPTVVPQPPASATPPPAAATPQDPNALSPEDQEILDNLDFFSLFQLLRDLNLFTETP